MKSDLSSGAEQRFREAFERLKFGVPQVLPKGSNVSQNNVAKEAGCDPSALKKARFPLLVLEIQEWINTHKIDQPISDRQKNLKQQKRNRTTKEALEALKIQRDIAAGLLADANLLILELNDKVTDLQARLDQLQPTTHILSLRK